MSSKCLSSCQVRWNKFISWFNFNISYRLGAQCKTDALTGKSQNLPADSNPRKDYMELVVPKPKNLSILQLVQILRYQDIMLIEALDKVLE